MAETIPVDVIGKLREAVVGLKKTKIVKEIVDPKDAVLARFQAVFSAENITSISEEEFRSFLLLENNRHWSGLQRHGPRMCSDMDKLRNALATLLDENKPIAKRLDEAIGLVSGMGKNVSSAILMIAHPDIYGIWNNRSEANLKQLEIWPKFERGESFGNRYVKVNHVLNQLRDALEIDLWTLDALWWFLDQQSSEGEPETEETEFFEGEQRFGLERHLHEFLRDNWDYIELGQEWELFKDVDGEEAGYEYPCDIGKIDLLAKHKEQPKWLVVELKRNQTSDQTIGQLLRYIGWVKHHLATDGDEVYGMIICRDADKKLHYALSTIPNVKLRLYQVEFNLKEPSNMVAGFH